MPRPRSEGKKAKRPIAQYTHDNETRVNNPPVGLVDAESDANTPKERAWAYDPHLDPQLQWAGKTERASFEVPTVSLHVHERIDPRSILEAVRKKNGSNYEQLSLWNNADMNPPLRDAIEFYQHRFGWSNRLIAGDSLLVMNSQIEKEGMAGKVQMFYFDPPYGIRYGSNFQPFVNKRDVADGKDDDLTAEPEMIKAFRDTWELGIHSYLSYLRDRLLLARELLADSGSIFVQISDENVHHVREIMDEVFGDKNFVSMVSFQKTAGQSSSFISRTNDFLLWYAKDVAKTKFHPIFRPKIPGDEGAVEFNKVELQDGSFATATDEQLADFSLLPVEAKLFATYSLFSAGESKIGPKVFEWSHKGKRLKIVCPAGYHFKFSEDGLKRLAAANRILPQEGQRILKRYLLDFPYSSVTNHWSDTRGEPGMVYVVQTSSRIIQRCLLMTTDPGDLVMDITCGSGTTAVVAEQWGRRWVTCDTSRVALTLAKQRLMTSVFDYYQLAHPDEGVGSGFVYKKVPHITLKSIANNEPDAEETLYDQPLPDAKKVRVCGPFTVEAVPAPVVAVVESGKWVVDREDAATTPLSTTHNPLSTAFAREGETLRQEEWRSELLRTGIRGKNGQYLMFSRVEPLPGTRWLHAEGEVKGSEQWTVDREASKSRSDSDSGHFPLATSHSPSARRAVVSFGPAHAPIEQRQIEQALEEARTLVPKPQIIVFAAFQFDPEAAKDIDETRWPGVTLVKAQMNADLLTDDLKKKRASNESFWMVGQPDVEVESGEWIVDSTGRGILNPYETAKLSRLIGVAEIHGLGPADVSRFQKLAARGALRADQSGEKGGRVSAVEHRGGAGPEHDRGISASARDGEGVAGGTGDATDPGRGLRIPEDGGSGHAAGAGGGSEQNASRFDAKAALEKLAAAHYPLSTAPRTRVRVLGFDYFNPKTGEIESGGPDRIAVWMLDTDYDGRSLFPRQVFFPMAGEKEGWAKLAKNLKAEIDEDMIEAYRGTLSVPFDLGKHRRVAVKIIDDRGIESLKIVHVIDYQEYVALTKAGKL